MIRSSDRGQMELTITRERPQSSRTVDDLSPEQRAEQNLPSRESFSSEAEFQRERQRAILTERAEDELPSRDQFSSPEEFRREREMMADRIAEEENIRIGDPSAQQARQRIPSRDRFESEDAYRRAYEDAREETPSGNEEASETAVEASEASNTAGAGDETAEAVLDSEPDRPSDDLIVAGQDPGGGLEEATLDVDPDDPLEETAVATGQDPGGGMEEAALDLDPDGSFEQTAITSTQDPGDGSAEAEVEANPEPDELTAAAAGDVFGQESDTTTYLDEDLQSRLASQEVMGSEMATGLDEGFQSGLQSEEAIRTDLEAVADSSVIASLQADSGSEAMETSRMVREATPVTRDLDIRARFRGPDLSDSEGWPDDNSGSFALKDTSWETGFLQPEDVFDDDTDTGWWG
ncbi:hypothetical protein CP557_02125 [Natrinema ejinorense]|uniref:Uncharacterized protein n=2 Tax=Natrinema ejinorense TaxID=373386 RepID=A0A2A5QRH0_9EURY|nr:hypothetical protein CP557_02125 [Natrinema ejinorense]